LIISPDMPQLCDLRELVDLDPLAQGVAVNTPGHHLPNRLPRLGRRSRTAVNTKQLSLQAGTRTCSSPAAGRQAIDGAHLLADKTGAVDAAP
jgi:hypothetical protein